MGPAGAFIWTSTLSVRSARITTCTQYTGTACCITTVILGQHEQHRQFAQEVYYASKQVRNVCSWTNTTKVRYQHAKLLYCAWTNILCTICHHPSDADHSTDSTAGAKGAQDRLIADQRVTVMSNNRHIHMALSHPVTLLMYQLAKQY